MNGRRAYIFVTGGVISSVGKGITVASIAKILQSKGYRVNCVKCDMYVNIDAGTMRPTEHGEVFVTPDGVETDQDLGNYERFLHTETNWTNYVTTGQIYREVIRKERNLEYGGEDVEVVPHVPEEIIRRIQLSAAKARADITVVEIGGTVGEYQNILFLEADRMMKRDLQGRVINVHVSYLPIPASVGEMKTKPVQYSVRTLNAAGIQPEIVIGRSERPIDEKRKEKIAIFCSVKKEHVISNPDVTSIYEVPLILDEQRLGEKMLTLLGKAPRAKNLRDWRKLVTIIRSPLPPVTVGIIGKYFATGDYTLADSYISVIEAIKHAAWFHRVSAHISWVHAERFEKDPKRAQELGAFDGLIVPGGFGARGVEGKIASIHYARTHRLPYFGLCYGMQLAVVEFARNVLGLKGANTTEIQGSTPYPVIDLLPEQRKNMVNRRFGATMRLGNYRCRLVANTKAQASYHATAVVERHRHRYEVNNAYRAKLESRGMVFSGICAEKNLVEILELRDHPWFVGTQFHPEFRSYPLDPHPLFRDFIGACLTTKKSR